jgi:hypothetical protein
MVHHFIAEELRRRDGESLVPHRMEAMAAQG